MAIKGFSIFKFPGLEPHHKMSVSYPENSEDGSYLSSGMQSAYSSAKVYRAVQKREWGQAILLSKK